MILDQLFELLKSAKNVEEIDDHRDEILDLIPKLKIMINFDQKNYTHQYDLWFHSLHTVMNLPRGLDDNMLYLAALLHDIGKPDTQCNGKKPNDPYKHYYNHPKHSKEIVETIVIPELLAKGEYLSSKQQQDLLFYVLHHDDHVSLLPKVLLNLYNLAPNLFFNLLELEIADAKAHVLVPIVKERLDICTKLKDKSFFFSLIE